jgi:hypothetical protein
MRGVRWRILSPWAHNAGTAYKGAGTTTQDILKQNFLLGRLPGVRRVARGQTLQDDPLPDHAGRVGGEGPGDSTPGGVLQLLGGRVGSVLNKNLKISLSYVSKFLSKYDLKCPGLPQLVTYSTWLTFRYALST